MLKNGQYKAVILDRREAHEVNIPFMLVFCLGEISKLFLRRLNKQKELYGWI